MSSFEERKLLGHSVTLRPTIDVRDAIAWCRDNIQPRRGIIVSARLWSIASRNGCSATSFCWCSIRERDDDELAEYLTPESLARYRPTIAERNWASFAFHTRADSLLFDMRWR